MELTIVKKVKADGARITVIINPENKDTHMRLSYTCPECAGHGCNTHRHNNNECSGGTVNKTLEPDNLDATFTNDQLLMIKAAFTELHNKIFNSKR